jgi:hypothetical protein
MIARHSKPIKKTRRCRRACSEKELLTRRYHQDVRNFKKWCENNNVSYKTFDEASNDDICVLSKNELLESLDRSLISEDNECYFLNQDDYEKWQEQG